MRYLKKSVRVVVPCPKIDYRWFWYPKKVGKVAVILRLRARKETV